MMALPYSAAFDATRSFADMLKRGSDHIVNISSVASRFVWACACAYTAARMGRGNRADHVRRLTLPTILDLTIDFSYSL